MNWSFSRPALAFAPIIAKKIKQVKHGHFIAVMMKFSTL
jgi:hypothetical protein